MSFSKVFYTVMLLTGVAVCQQLNGGILNGGEIGATFNNSGLGPPNYIGSPHGLGTPVNITSVPNAGTSLVPACAGDQLYTLINCGNLTGLFTSFTDTNFSSTFGTFPVTYLRLADSHTIDGLSVCPLFAGAGHSNSFEIAPGGGDYTNVWNTNHTFVLIAQQAAGSFVEAVASNFSIHSCPLWPTGDGDTGTYSSLSTSGMMDNTSWWSGVSPNVFYMMPGTAMYKMTITGCDLTHTTTAQGCIVTSSTVHDFNGDACFGTELAACSGNTSCWSGVFDVDRTDTHFAGTIGARGSTFSVNVNSNGQGSGTKSFFYDTVNGCKEWETRKGLISPTYNSPPSQQITDQNSNPVFDRFGIHDDTMTRGTPSVFSVGVQICYLKSAVLPTPRLSAWPGASTIVKAGSPFQTTYVWLLPVNNNTKGAMVLTVSGGTTGTTEPNWDSLSLNGTVTDGTVVWIYEGNPGGLTDWSASTPFMSYVFIKPSSANGNAGGFIYQNIASSGGISGASHPAFNQTTNTVTTDGSASWLNLGLPAGSFGCGGPDQWMPSTNTIYTNPSNIYTGHYCLEDHTYIAGGGNLLFGLSQYSAWTNVQPLIPNNPAGGGSPDPGQHISCGNQNNGLDNLPIIGGMAYGSNALNTKLALDTTACQNGSTFPVSCASIANSPGYEVVGFQQANTFCNTPNTACDFDTYIRFGLGFDTGQSNFFNGQQMTGSLSQDGTAEAFTSDWMGTLGNTAGGTNCALNAIDWKASQSWNLGTIINPSVNNGSGASSYDYQATNTGTGVSTEPVWNTATAVGSTITEGGVGGVTWKNIGSPNGNSTNSAGCNISPFVMVLN